MTEKASHEQQILEYMKAGKPSPDRGAADFGCFPLGPAFTTEAPRGSTGGW